MAMTGSVDEANARIDLVIDWVPVAGTQLVGTVYRRVGDYNAPDEYVRGLYSGDLLGEQAYVSDHEAPLDKPIWYVATAEGTATILVAGPFTIESSGYVWMKDPGRPWADLRLDLCETPTTARVAEGCPPTVLISDTFSRTVVDDWGDADTGQTWVNTGGATVDFDVNSGYGIHVQPIANSANTSSMAAPSVDLEIMGDLAPSAIALGGNLDASLILRRADASNFYAARLDFTPASDGTRVALLITKRVAGVDSTIVSRDTLLTYTAGQFFTLRFQVEGRTLRARTWPVGTAEPDVWQLQVTDASLVTAGNLGFRTFSTSANTNVNPELRLDNFSVSPIAAFTDQLSWVGFNDYARADDVGLFPVLDREYPADVYARRKQITSGVNFLSRSLDASEAVYVLYTVGGPLLFQLPAVYGRDDTYLQPATLTEAYLSNDQRKPWRLWSAPVTAVDLPIGPAQGTDTANWCAVEDAYATFADLTASGYTWGQIAQGQAVPGPVESGYGSGLYGDGPYGG